MLTHGHYYNVSLGVETLREEAIERGCDIAMYGHTHRPYLEQGGKVTILNPGSLSYPRPGRPQTLLHDYGAGRGRKALLSDLLSGLKGKKKLPESRKDGILFGNSEEAAEEGLRKSSSSDSGKTRNQGVRAWKNEGKKLKKIF